jgi:hypothetical protein
VDEDENHPGFIPLFHLFIIIITLLNWIDHLFLFLNCVFMVSLSIKDVSDENNISRWPANRNVWNQAILKNHGLKIKLPTNLDGCIICTFTSVNLLKKFSLTDGWVLGRLEPVEQHWLMKINFSSTYYPSIHPSIHPSVCCCTCFTYKIAFKRLIVCSVLPTIHWVWCSNGVLVQLVDSFENKPQIQFLFVCF